MSNYISAAPYLDLTGIKDASTRAPVSEAEQIPTFLPHVFLYAQKGPTKPTLATGGAFSTLFGTKTLDPRYAYHNHQSELAATVIGGGGSVFVQRLKPADAGPNARVLLSLDIVADQIQQYERNSDGTFRLGNDGNKIPLTGAQARVAGYRARWVINDWMAGSTTQAFGAVTSKAGGLTSSTDAQSTTYPIFELEASHFGADGNNQGIRLVAPTSQSGAPLNDTLATSVKSYLYRLALVDRESADSTVTVVETLAGDQSIDFSFAEGVIDTGTDTELSLSDLFEKTWSATDTAGVTPIYGPFGKIKIYQSNLKQILAMVAAAEAPSGLLPELEMDADSEFLNLVNIIGATDLHGVPYYTFQLEGPAQGGTLFTDSTAVWAQGGSDGTMSFAAHDLLVRDILTNYAGGEFDLLDDAIYPFSAYIDSGYTLETKLAHFVPLGHRKDVWTAVSTQDISQPQNTGALESSMAISLKNAARLYPESEIHGTSVCRAVIIGHSGQLIDSKYKGPQDNLLPLTIEFAGKCAAYMGAGSGIWNSSASFDSSPNNQITRFKNLNVTSKNATARNADWKNGLVWAQNYDMRSVYVPALQTVYDDDSSVLNSFFNMVIAVDLEKVGQKAFRDLVGVSGKMTNAQFVMRSNQLISDRVEGRYDNRVTIRPNTFFTAADEQRGWSWHTEIHMYGENMRTVGTTTVVAHRSSDLAEAA
ncbi:hypothetical protein LUCX_28 [Xanthomonas phage vB_XciM_LucasX]|nr:hypothetical protein LUCX_28 [Xanthomonas phage vB_XciM_LucasX]